MRKALYILGILEDADVSWLAQAGHARQIGTDTVIIRQGVPIDSVFIVIDGELMVYAAEIEIARLRAGEMVGEISFVDLRPPSASVKATVPAQVLEINKAVLRGKIRKDPGFAARFYLSVATFLADRLRVTTARLSGGREAADTEKEDFDELGGDMLEHLALASTRFDMMVKALAEKSTEQRIPGAHAA